MAKEKRYIPEIRERTILRPLAELIAEKVKSRDDKVRIEIVGVDAEDPYANRIQYRIIVASEVLTIKFDFNLQLKD